MNILILNGSPRKNGNTKAMIDCFMQAAEKKHTLHLVELQGKKIAPCRGCGACEQTHVCPFRDDAAEINRLAREADLIVFASPVYWWGISAQLKLAIDRFQSEAFNLRGKKIGVLTVGGDGLESPQYRLIREQFACMAEYLNWQYLFFEAAAAYEPGEVKNQPETMAKIAALAEALE